MNKDNTSNKIESTGNNERSDSELLSLLHILEEAVCNFQITTNSMKKSLTEDMKYTEQLISECNKGK